MRHEHADLAIEWFNDTSIVIETTNDIEKRWWITDTPKWKKGNRYRKKLGPITSGNLITMILLSIKRELTNSEVGKIKDLICKAADRGIVR